MKTITKSFPGVKALDGVTFDLKPGEIHALVGENGAGKSTLIKILAGVYPHPEYGGEIILDASERRFANVRDSEHAGIAVIYQELSLVKDLNVAENIFLAVPVDQPVVDSPCGPLRVAATVAQEDDHRPLCGVLGHLRVPSLPH